MDLSTREGKREQGERIRGAAREAGLTPEELAQQIGCSRSLIYQYISGASLVQTDRLQQIAQAVGKPLEWFFRSGDDESPAAVAEERRLLDEERAQLVAERARFDGRRLGESEAHLYALLDAYSAPPDWRRVADTCQQLELLLEREDRARDLAELLLRHGNSLVHLHEWGAAKEKLERAGSLFRQEKLADRALSCLQSLGQVNAFMGRAEEALLQFQQVAASSDWWNRWQGALSVGAAHELMGDYAAAAEQFGTAMAIVEERAGDPDAAIGQLYVDSNWANVDLDCGELRSAVERAERCVRLAQRQGIQDQYIEALLTRGMAQLALDDLGGALSTLQQALDVAELTKDHQRWSMSLAGLSLCRSATVQPAPAIAAGKEALTIALRYGASRAEIQAQRALAGAYLSAGNAEEALYHAEQGLEQAVSQRLRLPQAQLGVLKGWALLRLGRPDQAKAAGRVALKIADALDAMPTQYEAQLLLAHAAVDAGGTRDAEHHSAMALTFARTLAIDSMMWPALAIAASAKLASGAPERDAFAAATAAASSSRKHLAEATGEDTLMEDARAQRLWRDWLSVLDNIDGAEAARAVAEEAEWPPLLDWLQERHAD